MSAIETSFDDYQRWTESTAVYPREFSNMYLGLGLGDEAGELLEKVTETEGEVVVAGVLGEVGDVMWYLGQLLLHRGHKLGDTWARSRQLVNVVDATLSANAIAASIAAGKIQGRLKKELRDQCDVEATILLESAMIVRQLEAICRAFGTSLVEVLVLNQRKLSARKEAGTIKGDGDGR